MTEREAWLYLAKKWSSDNLIVSMNKNEYYVYRGYYSRGDPAFGLCCCIDVLPISGTIRDNMHNKIDNLRFRNDIFVWSNSKSGAKARVRFCLKQAKLLSKKP